MKTPRIFALFAILTLLLQNAAAASDGGIVSRIRREPVVSSNVASIGYSRHLRALEIEFTRGAVYRFLDVPKRVYRELMESSSKGHFIAENLRDHYQFIRVRSGKTPNPDRLATHD
jgi:hypothetical protein